MIYHEWQAKKLNESRFTGINKKLTQIIDYCILINPFEVESQINESADTPEENRNFLTWIVVAWIYLALESDSLSLAQMKS